MESVLTLLSPVANRITITDMSLSLQDNVSILYYNFIDLMCLPRPRKIIRGVHTSIGEVEQGGRVYLRCKRPFFLIGHLSSLFRTPLVGDMSSLWGWMRFVGVDSLSRRRLKTSTRLHFGKTQRMLGW